jgi:hypothetical protein
LMHVEERTKIAQARCCSTAHKEGVMAGNLPSVTDARGSKG